MGWSDPGGCAGCYTDVSYGWELVTPMGYRGDVFGWGSLAVLPVRAVSQAVSRLPAAVDDGEQWEARHTGGKGDRGSNRTYLLGRARDQWSTIPSTS